MTFTPEQVSQYAIIMCTEFENYTFKITATSSDQ